MFLLPHNTRDYGKGGGWASEGPSGPAAGGGGDSTVNVHGATKIEQDIPAVKLPIQQLFFRLTVRASGSTTGAVNVHVLVSIAGSTAQQFPMAGAHAGPATGGVDAASSTLSGVQAAVD
jgi:hypothetical protein